MSTVGSRTVWVHRVNLMSAAVTGPFTLDMPAGAEVVHVERQGNDIGIWFVVDPNAELTPRRFVVLGTGGMATRDATYRGTALFSDGALVLHVWELT